MGLKSKNRAVERMINTKRIKGTQFQTDKFFMQKALEKAKKAGEQGEVPIASLIVDKDDKILGIGMNQVEKQKSQTAHAELLALQEAAQTVKDWRLEGATLYVTLEPCSMCIAAAKLSRISRVVYGADSPLFGFSKTHSVYDSIAIKSGILEKKSAQLLKNFFTNKRSKN